MAPRTLIAPHTRGQLAKNTPLERIQIIMWCSDDLFERNSHVSLSSHLLLRLRLFKLALLIKIFHTRFIKINERFSKLAFSLIINGYA